MIVFIGKGGDPARNRQARGLGEPWAGALCGLVFLVLLALFAGWGGGRAAAQGGMPLSALARVDPAATVLRDLARGVEVEIGLSQPVPYRIAHLDTPRRLVIEFSEARFDPAALARLRPTDRVRDVAVSQPRPGWSRLTLGLAGPFALAEAALRRDTEAGSARLHLRLAPVSEEDFAARVAAGAGVLPRDLPPVTVPAAEGAAQAAPLVVMLDPGHGGIDPGAERDGHREADLVLGFARELAEVLTRSTRFTPVLTRSEDVFVSLEARIRLAHEAGADVFLSLHADALEGGGASGAALYILSEEATDAASAALAERHNRDDLVAGIDLTGQDDRIAGVLMDLARRRTEPRTEALARAIVEGLEGEGVRLYGRPLQRAAFSVLKAPDIPSVLIELGFLSNPGDLENLLDPDWRGRAARGIATALERWARDDAGSKGQ